MKTLTSPPKVHHQTLLYSRLHTDVDTLDADIAVVGMPFGSAYSPKSFGNDQSKTPQVMRELTDRFVREPDHYDFDIDGPLLQNRDDIRFVDCGDVLPNMNAPGQHYAQATELVRKIVSTGGLPIILGGDHGITTPMLQAYDVLSEPVTVIHIDAHLDWRDEVNGIENGLSSPIRRASEMAHIGEIYQIGLRAQGSARTEELLAARAYGAHLITAYELHEVGMQAVLDRIPAGGRYYLTIDADGMDPSIMPAVDGPAPGGVTFLQARQLIHGLVKKGRVVGMDIVEIQPSKDSGSMITCVTAGRLIVNLIGASIRAGYFDR